MTTADLIASLETDPRVRISATGNWLDAEPISETERWSA